MAAMVSPNASSPFELYASDLVELLHPERRLLPELDHARGNLAHLLHTARGRALTAEREALLQDVEQMPQTTYSRYQAFARDGEREPYQDPYFLKRHRLNALVMQFLAGRHEAKEQIEDYLWAICEESTWVVPAHARVIDLMAAETALWLAEAVYVLQDALDDEVRRRVWREIDDRIFTPFMRGHYDLRWFKGSDNWNGVCSGAIGGAFLYLEQDQARLGRALSLILESLDTYLSTAFEADGGTTEGVGYWRYGLNNVVIFAELLRAGSGGTLNLLADSRLRQIAAFPAKMLLPNQRFVSFSDCPAEVLLSPGLIARLAERTGEPSLLQLLTTSSTLYHEAGGPRGLRNLLWWDGAHHDPSPVGDVLLPATGIARLTAAKQHGEPIVLMVKAGHNGENHNHNDVGSFVLNIAGEDFLTDPGPGRITRDYFIDRTRYANLFTNSEGHSVPLIDGVAQGTGRAFYGALQDIERADSRRSVALDFTQAYPVATLESAHRRLTFDVNAPVVWLEDAFTFADAGHQVEERLITWLPVSVDGATAVIRGQHHALRVTLVDPPGATLSLDSLHKESRVNDKADVVQRLRVSTVGDRDIRFRFRFDILPACSPYQDVPFVVAPPFGSDDRCNPGISIDDVTLH